MTEFFTYLNAQRGGILILFLSLALIVLLVNWVAWVFSWGRYKTPPAARGQNLRYVFSEAAVKISNDFRHLLALIIVMIFALALGYAMIRAQDTDKMKDALQAVVASLGGLVGSIKGAGQSPHPAPRKQESLRGIRDRTNRSSQSLCRLNHSPTT